MLQFLRVSTSTYTQRVLEMKTQEPWAGQQKTSLSLHDCLFIYFPFSVTEFMQTPTGRQPTKCGVFDSYMTSR